MNIEISNLNFSYEDTVIFEDFSVTFQEGLFTCIVGSNGSGKSTLAKILVGIIKPDSGNIIITNNEQHCNLSNKDCEFDNNDIGLVFQNPDNQFVNEIVRYDIAFGLENMQIPNEQMDAIINEFSELLDIKDFLDDEILNLSGGQKQRVAIAGILAMGHKVVILDEASSMLDPISTQSLISYLKSLASTSNLTIISITHDMNEALLADKILVLEQGKIAAYNEPREIFYNLDLKKHKLEVPYIIEISKAMNKRYLTIDELLGDL